MSTPLVSVVVPMYNEEANLSELHARLIKVLAGLDAACEIVYVDDGSTDNTPEQLEMLLLQPQPICTRAVRLPHRRGKTAALSAGFAIARGSILVTTDADLQEPPEVLPMLVSKLRSGEAHLVVAWRQQRQDTLLRVFASRLFNSALRWITGLSLHDMNCGTKAMKREVAENLEGWLISDMHRYLPVLAARMGYRVAEAPVPHVVRRRGRSRFGASRYLRAAIDLLPVSLLWWRGWLLWLLLVASSTLLVATRYPFGWLGLAAAMVWAAGALRFWLRRNRRE
ncbi:MAG: glycosyltransferase family 2 protein [Armatimonadota bacterium]|nr:glycosyltransferase family 2 protein [bacterium]MDW8321457.1 glycosyltransferase family 2 protein [Armatimonadota bacterium]